MEPSQSLKQESRFTLPYYGWIVLFLAGLAMVATLPGRSVGLGLITESLLADLSISRVDYAVMTFWATLIGAAFAPACGPLIDRFGVRTVGAVVLLALGAVVLAFGSVNGVIGLAIVLILVRGFGQSALSVVSLATVGKWFSRRLSLAMALFSILIGIGFIVAIATAQETIKIGGWRPTWTIIGWSVLALGAVTALFLRRSPEAAGLPKAVIENEMSQSHTSDERDADGFTLKETLRLPAFWVFTLGSALYNFIIAGVILFNESVLAVYGFDSDVYNLAIRGYVAIGLIANLAGGWMALRWSIGKLMSFAMAAVAAYLILFPFLQTPNHVLLHAMLLGAAGGIVTVLFFTAYGKLFGRPNLGKIQGVAQVFTVTASATGPWFLAQMLEQTGHYHLAFLLLTPITLLIALAAWWVPLPEPATERPSQPAKSG